MNPNLSHLYISPLEACNLGCQICYTTKTTGRLSSQDILDFIHRYQLEVNLQTITFCGGEVFLLTDFPQLVNACTQQGIYVQIITNGTVDRLTQLSHPHLVNLIISLDGLPNYHDLNRGAGNWRRSLDFIKSAINLGFHFEIFSIITQENLPQIDQFEAYLAQEFSQIPPITYHPRKPKAYLDHHPVSRHYGSTTGFSFLTSKQLLDLGKRKSIFPPPHLACYQISLMSDAKVYGCCEGIQPLGSIKTDIKDLISKFNRQIDPNLNCIEPNFVCGLKDIYSLKKA